jgi:DNA replication ATP-dependent helicase Dna2
VPALERTVGDRVDNLTEAQIVQQIVEAMNACGVVNRSIGVISQYRSQLRLLHKLLRDKTGIEILTADKAQGRDKECIIVSLVRSNERQLVGDLLRDWRRLNVAFTRAMGKLIVIGSRKTLESATALNEFLRLIDSSGWMYDLPVCCTEMYRIPQASTPKKSPGKSQPRRSQVAKASHTYGKLLSNSPVLRDIVNETRASK